MFATLLSLKFLISGEKKVGTTALLKVDRAFAQGCGAICKDNKCDVQKGKTIFDDVPHV